MNILLFHCCAKQSSKFFFFACMADKRKRREHKNEIGNRERSAAKATGRQKATHNSKKCGNYITWNDVALQRCSFHFFSLAIYERNFVFTTFQLLLVSTTCSQRAYLLHYFCRRCYCYCCCYGLLLSFFFSLSATNGFCVAASAPANANRWILMN